jgi:endoglucanase
MRMAVSPSTLLSFLGALAIVGCAHGIDVALDLGAAGSAETTGRGGANGVGPVTVVGTTGASTTSATGGTPGGAGGTSGGPAGGTGGLTGDASAGSAGASGAGAAGAVVDAMAEPPPPPFCPTCPLRVQYTCFQDGSAPQGIEFGVRVANASAAPVTLNAITIRYWYTEDGTGTQQPSCVGAAPGCAAVSLAVRPVTPARPMADAFLEIGFVGAAMLAPNTDTGEIRITIGKTNAVSFNQPNDYSFRSTGANYVDAPNITAYQAGGLVWGTEP